MQVNSGADVSPVQRKAYLVSQLKGTAALWLEGLRGSWIHWEYDEMIRELKEVFRVAQTTHAEKLKSLRMQS
jgi:hypothetical protein